MSTSFTNASNHSGLTVESSRRLVEPAASSPTEFMGEHASDSQLWSHILLGVGSNGELHNIQDVGENLLDALSSKSISSGIFEPACDYLKKMDDNNWEFTNSPSINNLDHKHINGFSTDHLSLVESERVTKLSNLVSNWTIAPPDPGVLVSRETIDPITCNISLSSSANHYSQPQTYSNSASCETEVNRKSGFLSCYDGHDLKLENEHCQVEAPSYIFRRSFNNGNGVGYNIGLSSGLVVADNSKHYYGMPDNTCTSARNFTDGIGCNGRFNKPSIDIEGHKYCFKSLNLSDSRKQKTGRGQGNTSEGKKKRSDDKSEMVLKKPKHESSTVSSAKMQVPKVKLGDRITALQQIVSPFGKTDTASVLLEAIQYIKFLQEQVQLLSSPYMKNNSRKDPWESWKRKTRDVKVDLRSRGLCLVPTSCTPQIYHENTGSDYWTPTYRSGCLYRLNNY
ncbi:hypothetical protein GH714_008019 [Hevea brasiliensis]|uniref:BHLH domain-containing protein n=1 Tax=Hevea brasiliensis TaxID=3981 RepID=A0A6A6LWC7_HEVBR|nr:hypothetical protein GH714_008019 [Hevea brasiliensis]